MDMKHASAAAALTLAALAGCGSGPAAVQVRGSFDVGPFSQARCVTPGSQVTVTDVSGKVLATATLPLKPASRTIAGVAVDSYGWTATVPPETRYGITAGSLPPYYVTQAQAVKGTDLSC